MLIYRVSGHKKCYEELNPEPTATVTVSAANPMIAHSPRLAKLIGSTVNWPVARPKLQIKPNLRHYKHVVA